MKKQIFLLIWMLAPFVCVWAQSDPPKHILGDSLELGRFYLEIGYAKLENGNIPEALQNLKKAKPFLDSEQDIKGLASFHLHMAGVHRSLSNYDLAIHHSSEGMNLAISIGDSLNWELNRILQASIFRGLGYYSKSEIMLRESIEYLRRKGNSTQLGAAYVQLGITLEYKGNFPDALYYYQEALVSQRQSGSVIGIIIASNNVGVILRKSEKFAEALTQHQEVLSQSLEVGFMPGIAYSYLNIGINLCGLGRQEEGLVAYQKAAAGFQSYKAYAEEGDTYRYMAKAYTKLEKFDLAESHFNQAFSILHKIKNQIMLLLAYGQMGEMYEQQNRFKKAISTYQIGLSLCTTQPENKLEGDVNPPLHTLIPSGELLPIIYQKARAQYALSQLESDRRQSLQKALSTFMLAGQILDSMRQDFDSERFSQMITEQNIPIYGGALACLHELYEMEAPSERTQWLDLAFHFSEKSKSILLYEAIRANEAKSYVGIPATLQDLEIKTQGNLAFFEKKVQDAKIYPDQFSDSLKTHWQTMVFKYSFQFDSLSRVLQQAYPEYFRLKYDSKISSLSSVRETILRTGEGVLTYFWGEKKLYVFFISGEETHFIALKVTPELEQRLVSFIQTLKDGEWIMEKGQSQKSREEFVNESHFWFQTLIDSIVPRSFEGALAIVPDGLLGYLPFETLISKPVIPFDHFLEQPFLLTRFPIRYGFSATLLLTSQSGSYSHKKNKFVGFAPGYSSEIQYASADLVSPTASGQAFPSLFFSQPEVEDISRMMNGTALLSGQATESKFKEIAQDYEILHLAMHAFTHDENPMFSGMVFEKEREIVPGNNPPQNDGILHSYELYNLNLNAELVVLSACQTGEGKLLRGEGILSLGRAFRYAGCPNILMSLWAAHDESTHDIMKHFYKHLKAGKSKSACLQQAKIDYLHSHEKDHPYFWAGFTFMGDGEALENPSLYNWKFLLGVLFAIVLLVSIFYFKRKITQK